MLEPSSISRFRTPPQCPRRKRFVSSTAICIASGAGRAPAAMERAIKVQKAMLQAMAKKITSAEILGISDRHMRRWRERYAEFGFRGLFDRRRGRLSVKRLPRAVVARVLGFYRDRYFDPNVRHFHEKLQSEHQIRPSCSWVKGVLQGAGLVARGRKRGVHPVRSFLQIVKNQLDW